MGSCVSCKRSVPTAKLVVEDGGLQEFINPVKVADILKERRGFFVCDCDEMAFDKFLTPLRGEHQVQLNHLYFLLPLAKLHHRLASSELVEFAVKAGAALKRSGKINCRKIRPLAQENTKEQHFYGLLLQELGDCMESEALKSRIDLAKVNNTSKSVEKSNPGRSRKASARNTWTTMLSPIPESPINNT